MQIPANTIYPRTGDRETVYLNAVVSDPNISVDVYKRQSRCSGPVSFTMQRSTREAEMHWEITVAMATPATSSLQTMTKKRCV